jgi:hypothetical protein
MSKVIRELASNATSITHAMLNDDNHEQWWATWIHNFADQIIVRAATAILETTPEELIQRTKIVEALKEYFYSIDPDGPNPIVQYAIEATEFCEKEYKDCLGSTAWQWEESYGQLLVEGCLNAIYGCDPSPKMIVHEPYRSIGDAVWDTFYSEDLGYV